MHDSIFLSPHNDDETLFGAFTLLREKPLVVIVFDSFVQPSRGNPGTEWTVRRAESIAACKILGCEVEFLGFSDGDDHVSADAIRRRINVAGLMRQKVFAPAVELGGHAQHNLVAASIENGPKVTRYMTYTPAGKSTSGHVVPILEPGWIGLKLQALACYGSQWAPRLGCYPHFLRDQTEYYV